MQEQRPNGGLPEKVDELLVRLYGVGSGERRGEKQPAE